MSSNRVETLDARNVSKFYFSSVIFMFDEVLLVSCNVHICNYDVHSFSARVAVQGDAKKTEAVDKFHAQTDITFIP